MTEPFIWPEQFHLLNRIASQKPVVHCITNYVTARDVANLLLAAGASPIMADHEQEVEEIARISQALVLNLGTFKDSSLPAMIKAGKIAASLGHPIVLDPVGVGASSLRMESALKLLRETNCTAIRGNVSEIMALADRLLLKEEPLSLGEKGVDAGEGTDWSREGSCCGLAQSKCFMRAGNLALATNTIVIMTGPKDLVTDGRRFCLAENGCPMMSRMTGSGCMLNGIAAAALSVSEPHFYFEAALYGVCAVGICGETAWKKTQASGGGCGTFAMYFMDAMSQLTDETAASSSRVVPLSAASLSAAPSSAASSSAASSQTQRPQLDLRLYAVTDRSWTGGKTLKEQLEEALKAGVTMVQLREKELDEEAFLKEALEIKELTDRYHVPLIINDNLNVTMACKAAGIHLGQQDLDPREARRILGPGKIIGVTAKTVSQAQAAQAAGADYLGSGAIFGSSTKKDALPMTMEQLAAITASVSIPVVAIGGITPDNVHLLDGTGVAGAAVVSGIFAAPDITEAVKKLREVIDAIRSH